MARAFVMTNSRKTEERLRTWLAGDQAACERLCAHLLPLLGLYSHVEPRRPKGGPDGSRDLTARYRDELEVWGAIGFRNSPSDSPDDKKWVNKKFRDDLESALKENTQLGGFVFFTNVDLTPGEQEKLKKFAKGKGVTHIDLFIRENLRLALDSIEGCGYRLQYLDIEMSKEEQLAFIGRYGSRLEALLEEQQENLRQQQRLIENKLARIEFMHDCSKPVLEAMFSVELDRAYTPTELGHFRILLQVTSYILDSKGTRTQLMFGSEDDFRFFPEDEISFIAATNQVWSQNPDEIILNSGIPLVPMSKMTTANQLDDLKVQSLGSFATRRLLKTAFRTLGSFDRSTIRVYVTRSLFYKIKSVTFVVNDYLIASALKGELVMSGLTLTFFHPPSWYEELSKDERSTWVHLQVQDKNSGDSTFPINVDEIVADDRHKFQRPTFNLNFSEYTPRRIGRVVPIISDVGAVETNF